MTISGRGDLHLGIFLERMRREGFELSVSPPKVRIIRSEKGELLEPYESVEVETDINFVSSIIDKMNQRKGILLNQLTTKDDREVL
jgi:GTP-binding protein